MTRHFLPARFISRLVISETDAYLVNRIIIALLAGAPVLFKLNIVLGPILCQQCAREILGIEQGIKYSFRPLSFW